MSKSARFAGLVWVFAALGFVGSVIALGMGLPDRVATHFNAAGLANGWMTRGQHIAFMCCFGVGFSAVFIALCSLIRLLPVSAFDGPDPGYWQCLQRRARACCFLRTSSYWMGTMSLIWAALLNFQIFSANLHSPPALQPSSAWMLGMVFIAITAAWIMLVGRYLLLIGRRSREARV